MRILYFLFVRIVEWLLPLVAFLSNSKKIKLFVAGRKNQLRDLKLEEHAERFWFHCASLGEFEQARPVIEKLKTINPDIRILISFFSPSGFEQKKNYELAEAVIYLPLDTPSNARRLLLIIKPKAAIFVKYEIWFCYLTALFNNNIPVYLISANFRPDQTIFTVWGKWLFNLLPRYKMIFLQTEDAYRLLESKGLRNIVRSGDTRYDRVLQNAEKVKKNAGIENFRDGHPLLILGSSWPAEEDILLGYLQANAKQPFKIIIAPHDIGEKHIAELKNKFSAFKPILYTEDNGNTESELLILDTIGHLASAYHYADIAFIGGGFTGQLHNILEPLAFGVPIITGPVHHKFPEAKMAAAAGMLFEVSSAQNLSEILTDTNFSALKSDAALFVKKRAGASDIVVSNLLKMNR